MYLQRGLLAPDEIKDVDVRAVKKKVIICFIYFNEPSPAQHHVEGRGQRVEETKTEVAGEQDGERNLAGRHLSSKIQVDFKLLLIMIVIFDDGTAGTN